ncbi:MAG: helix-turn-helix transcriptional regulator [Deltaproteobacteria bacterium]|nr:helix-turn-helix transcriptional regulator [Deltaproteobacteria bacterium]
MARPFKELRDRMSAAARARVRNRVRASLRAMRLAELRQEVSGLTQSEVAELMEVTQGAISQLEQREDVLLSNLAAYVRALGGTLELVARFPKAEVRVAGFAGTASATDDRIGLPEGSKRAAVTPSRRQARSRSRKRART